MNKEKDWHYFAKEMDTFIEEESAERNSTGTHWNETIEQRVDVYLKTLLRRCTANGHDKSEVSDG